MHRVLVCDDSLGFPTLMQTWLREDGRFEVVGMARGGEEVKRLIEADRPDLLVLDLLLPDVPDTPALVATLRELHPPLRIMLVSSLQAEQLEQAGASAGVEGVCNKGASAREMCDRLNEIAEATPRSQA